MFSRNLIRIGVMHISIDRLRGAISDLERNCLFGVLLGSAFDVWICLKPLYVACMAICRAPKSSHLFQIVLPGALNFLKQRGPILSKMLLAGNIVSASER